MKICVIYTLPFYSAWCENYISANTTETILSLRKRKKRSCIYIITFLVIIVREGWWQKVQFIGSNFPWWLLNFIHFVLTREFRAHVITYLWAVVQNASAFTYQVSLWLEDSLLWSVMKEDPSGRFRALYNAKS